MAKELTDDQRRLAEKNRRYWATREEEALRHYIKDEKQYDRQIQNIYKDMLDNIQKEIDGFYGRYASKEGISINEAKKRVTEADIKAYERKAKRYVKEKDFSKQANEEMRLYNLTMKVNRLELLKANIGLDLVKGHDELDRYIGEILQGRTMEELERQAGILGNTITINSKMAHAIPNSSFHNATFSDRIWMHQSLLKADLSKLLQTGLIQGKNPRVLAREIESRFNTSRYNAERLMRTELARVQIEVQKASLERNGFTQFEFLANSSCCDICQEKNKRIFKLDDFKYGDNAPPLHPHCRCTIAPYEDTTEFDAWLDHVGSGGETTWDEWKNSLKIRMAGSSKSFKRSLTEIMVGKAGLDKRRTNILNRLSQSGDFHRFEKDTISVRDLAYLSAATNVEFALFRSKNNDILIRGTSRACDITGDLGIEILERKYKWVAHSHVDMGTLTASIADRETLIKLRQRKSIIIGIDGTETEFYSSLFEG